MLLSMTGFGKSVVETPDRKIILEIKSLNSKQADISVRVPSLARELEMEIRNRVAGVLQRGKIDVTLQFENQGKSGVPTIDLEAVKAYKEQIEEISAALEIPEPSDWYATFLRLPEVLKASDGAADELDEQERERVFAALDATLDELMEFRRQEGARLEGFFADRIAQIRGYLDEVEVYEVERVDRIRLRITENLRSLSQVEIDHGRLEQEMIFYIEKLDVHEEKQRLGAHMSYFLETMDSAPGQGKKLGFIAQEMGREINTLGSKSNHADMQRLVVKMKDELEQIKEQVLNVM